MRTCRCRFFFFGGDSFLYPCHFTKSSDKMCVCLDGIRVGVILKPWKPHLVICYFEFKRFRAESLFNKVTLAFNQSLEVVECCVGKGGAGHFNHQSNVLVGFRIAKLCDSRLLQLGIHIKIVVFNAILERILEKVVNLSKVETSERYIKE